MESKICVEGALLNPKCVNFKTFEFDSEEQLFEILLDVLKSQLPGKLAEVNGCDGKPLWISEDAIDTIPPSKQVALSIIFDPLGDVPKYSENLEYREVTYDFELTLTVTNKKPNCVTWELVKFKNKVEELLVGAEFAVDGYNSVMLEPKGFTYSQIFPDGSAKFVREGQYRFSVTVTQFKNN